METLEPPNIGDQVCRAFVDIGDSELELRDSYLERLMREY